MTRRRIIVGLEPRPHAEPLISAAAALAERLPAELLGLFVENVELLHFAALPFAREVGLASGMRRPLDVAAMERSFRAAAREARERLEATAARVAVRCSFRVTRGHVARELLAAGGETDIVLLAPAPRLLPAQPGTRIVAAGDTEALRLALRARGGMLVVAGDRPEEIAAALLALAREEERR